MSSTPVSAIAVDARRAPKVSQHPIDACRDGVTMAKLSARNPLAHQEGRSAQPCWRAAAYGGWSDHPLCAATHLARPARVVTVQAGGTTGLAIVMMTIDAVVDESIAIV